MMSETINTAKVLSTRLLETLIIGAVVLFGVVRVMAVQTDAIIATQEKMIEKIDNFGKEQSRRTVMVEESFRKAHLHK